MSKALSITLVVIAAIALAGGLFFAGTMFGRNFGFGSGNDFHYGWNNGYGPGMMGQYGGYGMMRNRGGYGMMGGRGGYGMMNGYGYSNTNAAVLTVDQAKAAAQKYVAGLNNPDLTIADVMIFSNNAYVAVKETSTGTGAFELLVDPASQAAYPEMGPNMMWNLKYGGLNHQSMMGGRGPGMMGGWAYQSTPAAGVTDAMTVTAQQSVQIAQKYLDANVAGAVAAQDPMQFYGYYTLDFSRDGKIVGMLSVNGYSGQVFLHTWHGTFIEEAQ